MRIPGAHVRYDGDVGQADDELAARRSRVDVLIADGDIAGARRELEQIWTLKPGAASAGFIEQRQHVLVDADRPHMIKVGIVRSFTVEPLLPLLRAAAALHGVGMEVDVGGFNTYAQDLYAPEQSVLAGQSFDAVIVATQTRDVAPDLWNDFALLHADAVDAAVERVTNEFRSMLRTFRGASSAHLIVHSLEVPIHAAAGIADRRSASGQARAIRRINDELDEIASELSGVSVLDIGSIISRVGSHAWFDASKWRAMKMPIRPAAMIHVVDEWLRHLFPATGAVAKAVVVDLDNTLWGGVIGEVGTDGIDLGEDSLRGLGYREFQRTLRDIRSRGILLAVCSKNNESDALDVLERHPSMVLRTDDFSTIRSNWNSKADNLVSIADELDIGVDSLLFVDDNPAECDEVRRRLPEVTVVELSAPPSATSNPLIGHPRLERISLTDDDRRRAEMYEQQRERRAARHDAISFDDYLASLDMRITLAACGNNDVERVAQLTQKTNQFNVTTRRYSVPEMDRLAADPDVDITVVRAADRFGDHGIVGVSIVRHLGAVAHIDTLLLSCRVIGRGIEHAMVARTATRAWAVGAEHLEGVFIPTAKNAPAAQLFEQSGFAATTNPGAEPSGEHWRLDRGSVVTTPSWLSVTNLEEAE